MALNEHFLWSTDFQTWLWTCVAVATCNFRPIYFQLGLSESQHLRPNRSIKATFCWVYLADLQARSSWQIKLFEVIKLRCVDLIFHVDFLYSPPLFCRDRSADQQRQRDCRDSRNGWLGERSQSVLLTRFTTGWPAYRSNHFNKIFPCLFALSLRASAQPWNYGVNPVNWTLRWQSWSVTVLMGKAILMHVNNLKWCIFDSLL